MFNLRSIIRLEKLKSSRFDLYRFRSNANRRSRDEMYKSEKHIITETRAMKLDENVLSPVVRQYLEKNPSYASQFGAKLSADRKQLVRQYCRTTGRAERLFSEAAEVDLVSSTSNDENDVARAPIVEFPSSENRFQMNLGTEDSTVVQDKNVRCFGCGSVLQCIDRRRP